jgi:predicted component of type VI protein secretion system
VSNYWLKYRGTRFPIRRGETVVGRSPYCSIVLSNSQSSRQHCALRLEGEALRIVDLNSANGTWVNDVRIAEAQELEAGDIIRVGTDVLEVLPTQGEMHSDRSRPTTNMLKPPDPDPEFPSSSAWEEAPHTQTSASQLELVEALVASASEARRPLALAPMIQRAIEGLVHQQKQGGRPIPGAAATRLAAVIEILASWDPEELGAWRQELLEGIGPTGIGGSQAPRSDASQ